MSYILEALKKSQQERELGHVPTLETPTFLTEDGGSRPNPWILLSVILAALAVVIALYSALRGNPPVSEAVRTAAQTTRTTVLKKANQGSAAPAQELTTPASPQPASVASSPQGPASAPPLQEQVEPESSSAVIMDAPAAPPPQRRERDIPVVAEPLDAPTHQQRGKVPSDLIADIEAFKREVREAQSDTTYAAKAEEKIAPHDLRLPKDVRNRLPEFVMSAHIYDKEPSKRFVLINGLKTREGEESREEIAVEQILPDGAVLSFDGNRFFQRR